MRAREFITERLTPRHIHDLADRLGIAWDDDPQFLRMTKTITGRAHLDDLDQTGLRKIRDHLASTALREGGWDTTITQGTVIRPAVVRRVLDQVEQFVREFNGYLKAQGQGPVEMGKPTGSSAYHERDQRDDPDKVYGDIDLQMIAPAVPDMSHGQFTAHWNKLADEFIRSQRPSYVHPTESKPGHPIVRIGEDDWVQVDFMWHTPELSAWGAARVTPEHGVKGLLAGNIYSVLGELLGMSIQHAGVQYKTVDGEPVPFSKQKGTVLNTITTDPRTFIYDIFVDLYSRITGGDVSEAGIDPLLLSNRGVNVDDVRIRDLVASVRGLARSFQLNGMYGRGVLQGFSSAEDFLARFLERYEEKAMADVMAKKREKAGTPEAQARAESDRQKVLKGLEMVKGLFAR
jgi:hypothetical protein